MDLETGGVRRHILNFLVATPSRDKAIQQEGGTWQLPKSRYASIRIRVAASEL